MADVTSEGAVQAAPLIRIEELHRDFVMGDQVVHAVNGITTEAAAGEFLAVMGPSGSGKSTLLYLIGGLDRPTGGEIWVNGREIVRLDENELAAYRRREIGFIFQSYFLVPTMTALQNVQFPMIFAQVPAAEREPRAQQLLTQVGLEDRMNHRPTELSGGQQQRVAIARALANDPKIILADEPTGNLDTESGAVIMDLLAQLNREEGRTIVIVSHDPSITVYATRTLHLLDGRLRDGTEAGSRAAVAPRQDELRESTR
jgi:putative ABC transport system ATP-binding protein